MQTMREDAETILREAVAAAQPGRLVREALAAERLTGRIVLLAAGKAAWAMAHTQMKIGLGFEGGIAVVILAIILDRITQGIAGKKNKK